MLKLTLVLGLVALVASSPLLSSKLNPKLSQSLHYKQNVEILVQFKSTAAVLNSLNEREFSTSDERASAVVSSLEAHAEKSQASVQQFLRSNGKEFKSFWVNNQIFLKNADAELISKLASFDSVVSIRENEYIKLEPIAISTSTRNDNEVLAEWGVENIQANVVWTLPGGGNGTGSRVCTIDSGVRQSHEALRDNYLGEYGWFDPGLGTALPNDNNGHGTHCTGTIAGQNGIGVAPGARWQACKGCSTFSCSNADLMACGQWVACPTLANGSLPNCSLRPHVVSNSWAAASGGQWYDDVIRAWHAVNVIPVFANGNAGSDCSTTNYPADSQAGVIAVGATTSANGLAEFSSRGPSVFGSIKPDLGAPGEDVRSASHTGDAAYVNFSGTSMACPHVTGVVALLLGINERLSYNQVTAYLNGNADVNVIPPNENCGGVIDTTYPNNAYGFGKVNALKSARALIGQ